jgi:hypothetical protein
MTTNNTTRKPRSIGTLALLKRTRNRLRKQLSLQAQVRRLEAALEAFREDDIHPDHIPITQFSVDGVGFDVGRRW